MTEHERMEKAYGEFMCSLNMGAPFVISEQTRKLLQCAFRFGWKSAQESDGEPVAWITRDESNPDSREIWMIEPFFDNLSKLYWPDPMKKGLVDVTGKDVSEFWVKTVLGRDLEPGECLPIRGLRT